ncbi:hypothetical protein P9112_002063 [Eukaryota sp. TZLM1-RC]
MSTAHASSFSIIQTPLVEINAFFSHSESSLFQDYHNDFERSIGRYSDYVATSQEKRRTALSTLLDRLDAPSSATSASNAILYALIGCPWHSPNGSTQLSLGKQAASTLLELGVIPTTFYHILRLSSTIASLGTDDPLLLPLTNDFATLLGIVYVTMVFCRSSPLLKQALTTADSDVVTEDGPRNSSVGGSGGGASLLLLRILSDGVECQFCCTKKILICLNLVLNIQLGDVPPPSSGVSMVISRNNELYDIFKDHVKWRYPSPVYKEPKFIKEGLEILEGIREEKEEEKTLLDKPNTEFEVLFRQIYHDIHRFVIVLLRLLLNAGPGISSPNDKTYDGTILDVVSDFSLCSSSLLQYRHSNSDCECNTCSMADHELERHRELVVRATVSIIGQFLFHSLSNSPHQFLFIRKLLVSSSCNLLILKLLNQDTTSLFQTNENFDPVLRLLEFPVISPPELSYSEVLSSAKTADPPRTPLKSRIVGPGKEEDEEENEEGQENGVGHDEIVDRCEDVPLSPQNGGFKRTVKLKKEQNDVDDEKFSTPVSLRPSSKAVLTPLSRSLSRHHSALLSRASFSVRSLNLSDDEEELTVFPKQARSLVTVTLLCMVLEGLVQTENSALSYLASMKAQVILKHLLDLDCLDVKIIVLRLFKRLTRHLGKRWASRNSSIITQIYCHLPLTDQDVDESLLDEWLLFPYPTDNISVPTPPFSSSFSEERGVKGTLPLSNLSNGTREVKNSYELWYIHYPGVAKPCEYLYRNDLLSKYFMENLK